MSGKWIYRGRSSKKTLTNRRKDNDHGHMNLRFSDQCWHATMPVPRDVQELFGANGNRKYHFTASLGTDSLTVAAARLPSKISEWRSMITLARRKAVDQHLAANWAELTRQAKKAPPKHDRR